MRSSRKSSIIAFLWTCLVVLEKALLSKKQDWAPFFLAVSPMTLMDGIPAILSSPFGPHQGKIQ